MANINHSLSHTKWLCKYHVVFTLKYRRKIIYNQYRESLKEIIKTLCGYKGVEILEGHMMPDHVHLLLSIPPSISISSFMGCKCQYKNDQKVENKNVHLPRAIPQPVLP